MKKTDKKHITDSHIENLGGVMSLFVNGTPVTPAAYMTYLEKFNNYSEFTKAGYRLFSAPVLFSGRWISRTNGFTPFSRGIFDKKGTPDFTAFDETVKRILDICPDACIIPRVNMSMPEWWENENPNEVNILEDGSFCRESFYSQKWREDCELMLREFVRYAKTCKYASHIIGYHLAGGNTEEWFHFDLNAGFCKNAENRFKKYLSENFPETEYRGLPDLELLDKKDTYINDSYLTHFLEYASFSVADAVSLFARAVKEETENKALVGVFYGYTLEVTSPLWGTHALKKVLDDENIDFISSPNSYIGIRNPASDWTEMYPADSVRLHGKMCFQECDIRTHLTVELCEKDKSTDPQGNLRGPIWQGLKTKNEARNAIFKSFARQLIKGNGFWWFDMWGGWYNDVEILKDMSEYRKIYEKSLTYENRKSKVQVAVFIDESAYKYLTDCSLKNAIYAERHELGIMGTPYDMYDVFDFAEVYKNYKAFVFMSPSVTEDMKNALKICEKNNLPYLSVSEKKYNFSSCELRNFCKQNGVHIYCESDDILYINENYAAVHALTSGMKTIRFDKKYSVYELPCEKFMSSSSELTVNMKKGETKLFGLLKCQEEFL